MTDDTDNPEGRAWLALAGGEVSDALKCAGAPDFDPTEDAPLLARLLWPSLDFLQAVQAGRINAGDYELQSSLILRGQGQETFDLWGAVRLITALLAHAIAGRWQGWPRAAVLQADALCDLRYLTLWWRNEGRSGTPTPGTTIPVRPEWH